MPRAEWAYEGQRVFFLLFLLHFLLLDVAAWDTLCVWGTSFMPVFLCAVLLSAVQAQVRAACSIQSSALLRGTTCYFILWLVTWKGPLSVKHTNSLHLAKPHCFRKDPDTNMYPFFLCLEEEPLYGAWETEEKYMPYNHPYRYFFQIWPPALLPL